jgi:hypothetical protein
VSTKYIHHIHPSLVSTHLTLVPPPKKKTYFTLLPFFFFFLNQVYIDSPRGVHLGISGLYISCFNQINCSFPHYLLILYYHVPLIFNSLQYIMLYYIHI